MGEEAGDHFDYDSGDVLPPVVVCKGKRSKRQRVHAVPPVIAEVESSSSVKGSGWRSGADQQEDEDMALCLMLLARGARSGPSSSLVMVAQDVAESTVKQGKFRSRRPADCAGEFVFECRTCGRCFPSFQALGGHRTSHKKPRPPSPPLILTSTPLTHSEQKRRPPALVEEKAPSPLLSPQSPHAHADPTVLAIPAIGAMSGASRQQQQQWRVHECSICGAEFASGQALGGHMRRHRPLVPASAPSSDSDVGAAMVIGGKEKSLLELDLNMPAPCDEVAIPSRPVFAMLFPAPPSALLNCHQETEKSEHTPQLGN